MDSIRRSFTIAAMLAAMVACTNQAPEAPEAADSAEPAGSDEVTYELAGTRWALVRLGENDVKISEGGREAYIALNSADKSVVGFAGCNRISSTYEESGAELHFGEVIATRMACEDMPTETALLEAIKSTASWQLTGPKLKLLDAQLRALATFEARNL